MSIRETIAISFIILTFLLFPPSESASQSVCDRYASPDGVGDGLSMDTPFKINNFWPLSQPGDTLCLLDGEYTGADSMIQPPEGLEGTADAIITVRALNDGMVTIDGEGRHVPIGLSRNRYMLIEGMDAGNSSRNVVQLLRTGHVTVRRVVAYDAADGNFKVFAVHGDFPRDLTPDEPNLLEDVAGFGIARKIFSSYTADNTVIRRAWGSWMGSTFIGPKMTFTLAYRNYRAICENCIGTWTGHLMPASYQLGCNPGSTNVKCGQNRTTPDQPYGIIGADSLRDDFSANSGLFGSFAYLENTAVHNPGRAIRITNPSDVFLVDNITYIEPGRFTTTTNSVTLSDRDNPTGRFVQGLTAIGGADLRITAGVEGADNIVRVPTTGDLQPGESPYTGPHGAKLCYRYENTKLTDQPLWPWPMNQRIINAMNKAGYQDPVDVTATVERLLGPIPSQCRVASPPTSPPAPSDLALACEGIKNLFTTHCQ